MKTSSKILHFIRKNASYFVLALCILAIGLSATFAIISENQRLSTPTDSPVIDSEPDEPVKDVVTPTPTPKPDEPTVEIVSFIMPITEYKAVSEYSAEPVWCATLSRYSLHSGVDFFADEGTDVLAVYGGVVESITNDFLEGYTVTIDHGNGLKTVYNSLLDGDLVFEGQRVEKGDVIGQVSVSNRQEYKSGAHLHFEVYENGQSINPATYLEFDEK